MPTRKIVARHWVNGVGQAGGQAVFLLGEGIGKSQRAKTQRVKTSENFRAACLQNETAPEKNEKGFEKREKRSEKRSETCLKNV